jgi:hypothetical protein
MLYDPKWEQQAETKADPFSLASLIAWLEQQPAAEMYCYRENGDCLLAQYFIAHGYCNVNMGPLVFFHGPKNEKANVPRQFNDIAVGDPHTYGAALERARSIS